jgi:hypothetical protein
MSNLKLNNQIVPFKEFYGRNDKQMSKLIEDGRIPLSVAGLMQKRLDVLTGSDEVKSAWWDNYFDTGDGIFYHPEGNVKVVLGAQPIRELTSDSNLLDGALVLDKDKDSSIEIYNSLKGVEFKRNDLKNQTGKVLTKEEVKAHPIWNALVPDKTLLKEYVDATFAQGKERFGYDNMMGVWISSPKDVAVGRLWLVFNLNNYSDAGGSSNIDSNDGRLVGVVPEALNARGNNIPNPKNIVDKVHMYLNDRTVAQGVTKKGLLNAVQSCYK